MRVIRSNERDLTTDELKAAIAHAQASLTEHAKHGHLDQARAAYETRDNLLLALAERPKKEEVA
jgi:hypothetical protein